MDGARRGHRRLDWAADASKSDEGLFSQAGTIPQKACWRRLSGLPQRVDALNVAPLEKGLNPGRWIGHCRQPVCYESIRRFQYVTSVKRPSSGAAGSSRLRSKRQLAVYYVIDWILRRGTRTFNAGDVLEAANALSSKLVGASAMADPVDHLIQALLQWSYIERVNTLGEAQIVDANKPSVELYRLTEEALIALAGIRRPVESPVSTPTPASTDRDDGGPHDSPVPGGVIGRYQIVSELGRGGFGSVYEAWDSMIGRKVALKVIHGDASQQDPQLRTFFQGEIAAMGALRYPGIVPVFDVGEWQGRMYYVMELIDGVTLRTAIGSAIATPELVVYVGVLVARTFQYVHSNGFFRNDIKPENIMLEVSGRVFVLDFGTAVRPESSESADLIVGTPAYMPPEAFQGTKPDARRDIYALGLVLYELSCGRRPDDNNLDVQNLMRYRLMNPIPAPSLFRPVPEWLEKVILRCVDVDPERRYLAMEELCADLENGADTLEGSLTAEMVGEWVRSRRIRQEVRRSASLTETIRVSEFEAPPPPPNQLQRSRASTQVGAPQPTATDTLLPTDLSGIRGPALMVYGPDWTRGFRRYVLSVREVRIGRGLDVEIRLEDKSVSRVQAKIVFRDGRYHFFDFGSSNGALINGQRVERKVMYPLDSGTEIRFGAYRIVFEWEVQDRPGE